MLIQLAESDAQILECFSTLSQLRPHIEQEKFLAQFHRQKQNGYQLAFIKVDDRVIGVAGFFISESFAWGQSLYVSELVVDETMRSRKYGQHIFRWLIEYAKLHHCEQLHLDSGVQRFDAHRFYFQQRMKINSHHFSLDL
jgi:GNAT superfamily N-acetyltransferase